MAIGNHRETSAEVGYYALILFSIFVAVYFAYFGFVLAQIWFYNGELEPKPKKFLILSPHIKEQLRRKEGVFTNNDSTSSDAEGTHNTSSRIRHTEILDLNKEEDECSNDEERNALKEEKRISRMSAFLQDDCGDGSQFPYVPEIDPKKYDSVKNLTPYTLPRFRSKPPSYMQMGLKKLDAENWLKIDHTYKEFHAARAELLMRHHDEVIQIVEEGEIACVELMRDVVSFITRRYPNIFEVFERFSIGKAVRNKKTGEEFSMQKPWDVHPLEMCARLTMEDFNILKKSDFSGEHYL
jgi:hypothetical protein